MDEKDILTDNEKRDQWVALAFYSCDWLDSLLIILPFMLQVMMINRFWGLVLRF